MSVNCLIDGQPGEGISPRDRGFSYGDGVFRTLPVVEGLPCHWDRHFRKLQTDCMALALPCPAENTLLGDIAQLFGDKGSGTLKIVVTRGESARGYAVPPDIHPRRVLLRSALPAYPDIHRMSGVHVRLCELSLSLQPRLAGIKHLNRLENVLARMEWNDPDIHEGLLLDMEGYVIEGTMSNLFLRFGTKLATPDLSRCGVAGVTRDLILEKASGLGLEPAIEQITLDVLKAADEMVLCNSLIGVWQVKALDDHGFQCAGLAQRLQLLLEH